MHRYYISMQMLHATRIAETVRNMTYSDYVHAYRIK